MAATTTMMIYGANGEYSPHNLHNRYCRGQHKRRRKDDEESLEHLNPSDVLEASLGLLCYLHSMLTRKHRVHIAFQVKSRCYSVPSRAPVSMRCVIRIPVPSNDVKNLEKFGKICQSAVADRLIGQY